MKNIEIADIFHQITNFLEMDESSFRSRAYEKAARSLESLEDDVADIYNKEGLKGLEKISGIGTGLALAIEEYLKSGRIKDLDKLKKECPVKLDELIGVEGLGPKMVKVLYKELNIKNLKDLEKAAKAKKIRELDRFGEKSEKNILQGIEFVKKSKGRFLLGDILPQVEEIIEKLESLAEVDHISPAGSIRRMKESVGDVDILVVSEKPDKVMDYFTSMENVEKVWAKGETKSSVRLKEGFDCDLRVIKKESFGSALQYFTGNKYHNILTRKIAIKKKLKLNEYGIFRGSKQIAGSSEKEVYASLDLPYIEPELRENTGEIEAAQRDKLPQLVSYDDLKGDLHIHTTWSEGRHSLEQMAKAAQEMGYSYMAVTDHSVGLRIANGLSEQRLLKQIKAVDLLNEKSKNFSILKGCEVNIMPDGSLDISDNILDKLDIVVAAVHSRFKSKEKDMTKRIIKAIENPHVNIIAHPTGRIIMQREAYQVDLDLVFEAAVKNKVAMEINSYPARLDLKDTDIKKAIEADVKLVISTDSHSIDRLSYIDLGIAQARRGWAAKKDILNTLTYDKLLEYFE